MLADVHYRDLEPIIAEQLRPLVSELRLTDLVTFVDHVVNERAASVAEIVTGAAELHFAPGFIRYDSDADIALDWTGRAHVALGIIVLAAHFTVRLRVILHADHAWLELQDIAHAGRAGETAPPDARLLEQAFMQNRLGSRVVARSDMAAHHRPADIAAWLADSAPCRRTGPSRPDLTT
ncbi:MULTISPECIES: hypothetical protein [unclassified Roseitalea]|uniref:hypothetical protein n=1 Tax=unclassified Roseitalea TaxID=2639107 RepID=UPI00273FDB89|nr:MULTISPECIES: hypothetical protein [unclassified Roseitalea]